MTDLDPLIRLRRHTVEEKQKFLSQLYREVENLVSKRTAIEDQLERERDIAMNEGTPDASADYGRYAENVRKKIAQFNEAIKKVEARIDLAREDVRIAFAEMKKIQIVQRTRKEYERREEDAKESQELDEIALDGFRRREED